MATEVRYGGLPFEEAIRFQKNKVNIPTDRWDDLWNGEHAVGFMVAGANKAELLSDLRRMVDEAVAGGAFADFQKDFDGAVARAGWSYHGSRGWRTQLIYRTNLRTAYQAGRYRQMTDPDVLKYRPYWQYHHGDSRHPRPEHVAWDGLVLAADDPWWSTHYPANGWGCTCTVRALSKRQMVQLGKTGPDAAPPVRMVGGVPEGIDPGFAYNVGEAAYGQPVAKQVIDRQRGGQWVPVDARPTDGGRGAVPVDTPRAALGPEARSAGDLPRLWVDAVGGDAVSVEDAAGERVLVSRAFADAMGKADGRERFFPLIPEVLRDPAEIRVGFLRNETTGQYVARRTYLKAFRLGRDGEIGIVAEAVNGVLTGLRIVEPGALDAARAGHRAWARKS